MYVNLTGRLGRVTSCPRDRDAVHCCGWGKSQCFCKSFPSECHQTNNSHLWFWSREHENRILNPRAVGGEAEREKGNLVCNTAEAAA